MRLSVLNKNTLDSLKEKLEKDGIIPLNKADLTNIAKGMESCACQQIRGKNITELIKLLKEVLIKIGSMYRDELTSESICYQLIAPKHLLYGEYQQIKDEFNAFSQLHQLYMIEGVVLDNKRANNEILLSIFYFQGVIDITNSNEKTQLDLTDLVIPSFLRPTGN